jgi:TRAP-type C4-dicarboxylate transport system permease small subunit
MRAVLAIGSLRRDDAHPEHSPHPEEPRSGVSKDGPARTGASFETRSCGALLRMRAEGPTSYRAAHDPPLARCALSLCRLRRGLFLILIFVLMMGLSLGREINFNIPAGDDFASWCMAAMAFLGLAHTFKSGEMIRVGLLIDRCRAAHAGSSSCSRWFDRRRLRRLLRLARGQLTYAVLCLQRHVAGGVWRCRCGFRSSAIPAGLAILFIAFVDELVHRAARQPPRYEKPPAQSDEEIVERAMASGV